LAPTTVRSYMSAVLFRNQVLGHVIDPVLSQRISLLTRGYFNIDVLRRGPRKPRQYLPSHAILLMAQELVRQCSFTVLAQQSQLAAVVFAFLFASRADTVTHVLVRDLTAHNDELTFFETHRKSLSLQSTRQCAVPLARCFLARALVVYKDWFLCQFPHSDDSSLFKCSFSSSSSADQLSSMISSACSSSPALSEFASFSSHACRRGAAITMFSIGVPMQKILAWGAWKSEASVRPYLRDFSFVSSSPSSLACFSWMLS